VKRLTGAVKLAQAVPTHRATIGGHSVRRFRKCWRGRVDLTPCANGTASSLRSRAGQRKPEGRSKEALPGAARANYWREAAMKRRSWAGSPDADWSDVPPCPTRKHDPEAHDCIARSNRMSCLAGPDLSPPDRERSARRPRATALTSATPALLVASVRSEQTARSKYRKLFRLRDRRGIERSGWMLPMASWLAPYFTCGLTAITKAFSGCRSSCACAEAALHCVSAIRKSE
jgi:hypothetical protein